MKKGMEVIKKLDKKRNGIQLEKALDLDWGKKKEEKKKRKKKGS